MSNLAKQNQFAVNGYNFSENDYKVIQADQSQTLINAPALDAKKEIAKALIEANTRLGHKPKSDNEIMLTATESYNFLKSRYKTIKVQEICTAIEFGSFGEYEDDVVYISAKNVVSWVKTYLNRKINVFSTLAKAKEKEALKTAENDSKEKIIDYWGRFPQKLLDEVEFIHNSGHCSDGAWLICQGLDKIGFTSYSDLPNQEKKIMYKEEEKKVKAKELNELQKQFFNVGEHMLKKDSVKSQTIRECKKRCLEKFVNSGSLEIEEIERLCEAYIEEL